MKRAIVLMSLALVAGSASAQTILTDAQWMGFGTDATYTGVGGGGSVVGSDLYGDPRYRFDASVVQGLVSVGTYGFVVVTNSVADLGVSSTPGVWEVQFKNSSTNGAQIGAAMSAYVSGTKAGSPFSGFVVAKNLGADLSYVLGPAAQGTQTWDMNSAFEFGTYAVIDVTTVHAFGLAIVGGQSYGYPDSDPLLLTLDVTSDAPIQSVKIWGFDTIGNTENFTGNGDVVGLTADNAISGSEGVLTSANIIQSGDPLDPQCFYNEGGATNLFIAPPGPWETMTIRMRQLDGNPSDGGTAPAVFDINQVTILVNAEVLNLGTDIISSTNEANEWVEAVLDISVIGSANLESIRIDPVATDSQNFEIDYIQVSAQSWVRKPYDVWAEELYGLEGSDTFSGADPDEDTYNNLYEYAFGGDPTDDANIGFIQRGEAVVDGETNYFEHLYARRTDADSGLEYAFVQNGDLVYGSWTTNTTAEVGAGPSGIANYEIVTNRVETVNPADFFRVEVTGE